MPKATQGAISARCYDRRFGQVMKRGIFVVVASISAMAVTGQAPPSISDDPLFMTTLPI